MLLMLLVNGVISGSFYALTAIGLAIIYGTTFDFHFCYGGVFAASAYIFYFLQVYVKLHFSVSVPLTIIFAALLGMFCEAAIYRPLREKGGSDFAIMLSSLGFFIILAHIIVLIAGSDSKAIPGGILGETFRIGPVYITYLQITAVIISMFLVGLLQIYFLIIKHGKVLRAMAEDQELIEIFGLNSNRIRVVVYAIGSAISSIAAMLISCESGLNPNMGMNAVLIAFISVIAGGIGSPMGAVMAGFCLGILMSLGIWEVASEWQNCIAFSVFFIFIVVKPRGFLGRKSETMEV